jgi:S1-C subfamily serine protease
MSKTALRIMALVALAAVGGGQAAAAPALSPAEDARLEDVTKIVMPSVVKVEVGIKGKREVRKIATGVVIDKDGSIATTALISSSDKAITVVTSEGKSLEAEFVGMDPETRLAVVRAKEKSLPALAFADSAKLAPGAWIGVVSFSPENTPSVTQGIISSVSAERLRLNVWIVPGSSGSPVVNAQGQMVGLLRGSYSDTLPLVFQFQEKEVVGSGYAWSQGEGPSSGMAMAVPSDVVKSITDEIRAKGKVERGWMGVSIVENEDGRTEIVSIEKESPAELAKLRRGDIVLAMDGKDVKSSAALTSEIRKRKPGQDVAVKVERDGKPVEVKVKLGEYPEKEAHMELVRAFPRLFTPDTETPLYMTPRAKTLPDLERVFSITKRKYVGVFLNELTPELSEHFGLKDGVGLQVTKFSEKSPARDAGLKVGDVVFKVDGVKVETVEGLGEIVRDKKKGETVKVEFFRDKKAMSLDIPVGEEDRSGAFGDEGGAARSLLRSYAWTSKSYATPVTLKPEKRLGPLALTWTARTKPVYAI